MSAPAKRPRTRRSYALQLACEAAIWLVNLYQIVTRFHAMSFPMAASAVMILIYVPLDSWQAWNGLHRETA